MDLGSWVLVISELFSAFVRLRALKLNFSIFCHFLPLQMPNNICLFDLTARSRTSYCFL